MGIYGTELVERIDLLLLKIKKKRIDVCSYAGISTQAITHWKNKGAMPSIDTVIKIADFFNVSVEYLITGNNDSKALPLKYILIPMLSQKVSAGFGHELEDDDTTTQLIKIPASMAKYKNLKALSVKGDSMYPTLSDGDIVVCDCIKYFDGDGLYVIKTAGDEFVKRIITTNKGYSIISDNKAYPSILEKHDEVDLIGKVRLSLQKH
ncbi:MAG: XRE family transcriptional regulator [Treponemataceae bacterium]